MLRRTAHQQELSDGNRAQGLRRQSRRADRAQTPDRDQAADYYGGVSTDTIDRLINCGLLPIVRLPVQRSRKSGDGVAGVNRRILIMYATSMR